MTSVRRALAIALLERYLLLVVALGSNIILARLLTPEEIGIFSVSLAVVGVAQVLRDFGVGNFLIQERELTDDHVRTALGISLALGVALFVLVVALAPWAASFYGEPQMATTLRVVALSFLILPYASVALAMLRREMRFREILMVNIAAALAGFATTVPLALAGYGPLAMALGMVATNLVTGAGVCYARGRASLVAPSLRAWRAVTRFGLHSSAASVVGAAAADVNDIVLGKVLGFGPVAILSRAQGLVSLVSRELMNAVRNVAYPSYALTHREGRSVETAHAAGVTALTAIVWPFYGFLALYALETVRVLFGTQWDLAVPLVPVLAASAAAGTLSSLVNTAMTAAGRVDLVARAEVAFQPLRVLAVVLVAVETRSLVACAWVLLACTALYTVLLYLIKDRCIPTDYRGFGRGLLRSVAVTLLSLALPVAVCAWAGFVRSTPMPLPLFVLACAAGAVSWLVAIHVARHPIAQEPIVTRLTHRLRGAGR